MITSVNQDITPIATVIIPSYNRPEMLKEALKSVVNQSINNIEIIVVDDNSDTSLISIIAEFKDSRIKYIRKKQNKGVSHSRNVGVRLAKGEWLFFLDDDDVFLETRIEKQICREYINNYSISLCGYFDYDSKNTCDFPQEEFVSLRKLRKGNPYCGASGLAIKREVALKFEFDEMLVLGEDWDLFVRLAKEYKIALVIEPLFYYRNGTHESLSKQSLRLKISEIDKLTMSTEKNRVWLGEFNYRRRISFQILSYIRVKDKKRLWVKASLRRAGIIATLFVIIESVLVKCHRTF